MFKKTDFNDVINQEGGEEFIINLWKNHERYLKYTQTLNELPSLLREAPSLDLEILPKAVIPFIKNRSELLNVPPEMIMVPLYTAIIALIGRNAGIRPFGHDGFNVFPNTFAMIVGSPSFKKTPSMNTVIKILKKVRKEVFAEKKEFIDEKKLELEEIEDEIKACKKSINELKKDPNSQPEAIENSKKELTKLAKQREEIKKLIRIRRIIINDATPEALQDELSNNPEGLLLFLDELFGLFTKFNKSGQEHIREFILACWDGESDYTIDRIGRGKTTSENMSLTMLGAIQPGKLMFIVNQALKLGIGADGFLQRFQMAIYPEPKKYQDASGKKPDQNASNQIKAMFKTLFLMTAKDYGIFDPTEKSGFLHFDHEAQVLFNKANNDLEKEIQDGDFESEAFHEHIGKYRSFIPTLAMVNQIIKDLSNDRAISKVDKDSLNKAIALVNFFREHALKIYSVACDMNLYRAHLIKDKILNGEIKDKMTVRDIYQHGWQNLKDSRSIMPALIILQQYGFLKIVERPTKSKGGRPTEEILINPKVFEGDRNDK